MKMLTKNFEQFYSKFKVYKMEFLKFKISDENLTPFGIQKFKTYDFGF